VPLRPDITLEIRGGDGPELHLFDAKFRVDQVNAIISESGSPEDIDTEAAEERQGIFERGDLYKMHAYRDAITEARSVWILYPGDVGRFFPVDGDPFQITPAVQLPAREGVGAIPLKPQQEGGGKWTLLPFRIGLDRRAG
jgi:predicted component of viral defense system (DUF524 family)